MNEARTYLKPRSVEEALQMAAGRRSGFRFLAGGTDLLVNRFQGADSSPCLIDLTGIAELKQIALSGDLVHIGALLTLDELQRHPLVASEYPLLIEAARSVASPVVRRTATLGGNLLCENRCAFYNQSAWWREAAGYCLKCNGDICIATGGKKNCFSKFASDMAIALISLGATVRLAGPDQESVFPLEDLYTGDGVTPRKLKDTDLLRTITAPRGQEFRSVFKKLRLRRSLEFSSLSSALTIDKRGNIRIALGGVDPKPVVVAGHISDAREDLIKNAVKKARIVDNDVFPRLYRKEMISVFLRRSFEELDK